VQQLTDRLPDEEKLAQIGTIVREFDSYRKAAEEELRNRTSEWRSLASFLFCDLLKTLGIDPSHSRADWVLRCMSTADSANKVENLHELLDSFLHPNGVESAPVEASQFLAGNHSTANDNAAGLRGGGSAIEHVKRILEQGGKGFIVLFQLTCLDMINQRFGAEAVEDCLMAVAAYLTQSLNSDDAIYHWSNSSLVAILEGRVNEQILTAEVERIVHRHREATVNIGGRAIMLRIPLTFEITPVEHLQSADDLRKITLLTSSRSMR
jgi:GGDEF domain-containing protein